MSIRDKQQKIETFFESKKQLFYLILFCVKISQDGSLVSSKPSEGDSPAKFRAEDVCARS